MQIVTHALRHGAKLSLFRSERTLGDLGFDETYNIREAIDFLTEKLALREKLIQSAKQYSERDGGQNFSITVKRFEDLLVDFLRLYQPIVDRIAGHREELQKEVTSQKQSLVGVNGMIQVAKGVDVLAERVKELEGEAKGIEGAIKEKSKVIERVDTLLGKTRQRVADSARVEYESPSVDTSEDPEDLVLGIDSEPTRRTVAASTRKTSR